MGRHGRALEFPVRFLVPLHAFQRGQLRFGQDAPVLRDLRLEGLEPLFHRRQVVPDPDAADAGGPNRHALLGQLVGDAMLAPRGLIDRDRDDDLFDIGPDAVAQVGFASADLAQRVLATALVQLLDR